MSHFAKTTAVLSALSALLWLSSTEDAVSDQASDPNLTTPQAAHLERPDDPFIAVDRADMKRSPGRRVTLGGFSSVQVNVDGLGQNIVGDAANEPSLAVDPNDPSRMVIGWRQFDTVTNNFRQAGWAFTTDGGATWTFPGSIDAGNFRSDPVVGVDSAGVFYYYSLAVPGGGNLTTDMFRSLDGGVTWGTPNNSCGGDKAWFTVDRSGGIGNGHLYAFWNSAFTCVGGTGQFNRSTDDGFSWGPEINIPNDPRWGTLDVAANGDLYLIGTGSGGIAVARSSNAQDAGQGVVFDASNPVDLNGNMPSSTGPNPGGLLGQAWISINQNNGEIYALAATDPPGADPVDIHFSRSTDGGTTWSASVRVNDDSSSTAYQWFGTLSVAPNGRIDAIWNDTRNDPGGLDSELYYSFSADGGRSWSTNIALSPPWDPLVGHPQQNKIGDYYHMVSRNDAAHLAWAATFNGEQDVYYLRIDSSELFADGFESGDTGAWSQNVP